MVTKIPRFEMYLWQYNCHNNEFSDAAMHDWFQFLMYLCGVLRGESLYLVDLSDLCYFVIDTDTNKEPSPYHVSLWEWARERENQIECDCIYIPHISIQHDGIHISHAGVGFIYILNQITYSFGMVFNVLIIFAHVYLPSIS